MDKGIIIYRAFFEFRGNAKRMRRGSVFEADEFCDRRLNPLYRGIITAENIGRVGSTAKLQKSARPIYPKWKMARLDTALYLSITHPSGWISSWLFTSDNALHAFHFSLGVKTNGENYLFFFFLFVKSKFSLKFFE